MTDVDTRWRELLAGASGPEELEREASLVALRLVRSGFAAGEAARTAKATVLGLAGDARGDV